MMIVRENEARKNNREEENEKKKNTGFVLAENKGAREEH